MMTLFNWSARRSGASITIDGQRDDGMPWKVSAIQEIRVEAGRIVAVPTNHSLVGIELSMERREFKVAA